VVTFAILTMLLVLRVFPTAAWASLLLPLGYLAGIYAGWVFLRWHVGAAHWKATRYYFPSAVFSVALFGWLIEILTRL
jgi:hypothetical protein